MVRQKEKSNHAESLHSFVELQIELYYDRSRRLVLLSLLVDLLR
jgi:hypothetical protein